MNVLTPEQERVIAESIKKHRPYLLRLEEEVQKTKHGVIEVRLEVRNGSVDRMSFFSQQAWLREKEIDTRSKV